jgi:hypothetical protein
MEEEERILAPTMIIIPRSNNIIEVLDDEKWDEPASLEVTKQATAMIKKTIGGQSNRGLLIEVPSRYTSREILNHYQSVELGAVARALLLNSYATKLIGNIFLKLSKGKPNEAGRIVPLKLFTDRDEAIEWLLGQMKK